MQKQRLWCALMPGTSDASSSLLEYILDIRSQTRMSAIAVAFYDYAHDLEFSFGGQRIFHAASTVKLTIFLALLRAAESGRLRLTDRLHVRNRFRSQGDGQPFFLSPDRDGDPELYKQVGRTASLQALAETMIIRSSNLATNLLTDHLGVAYITEMLSAAGLESLRCARGVEDEAAFANGLNNHVTAGGLLALFRRIHEAKILEPASRDRFFDILFQQRFNAMIPAGLPSATKARVAHKTGEISTIAHDVGMIFLPGREPYVLVVLTEYPANGNGSGRNKAIASVSGAFYEYLQATDRAVAGRS